MKNTSKYNLRYNINGMLIKYPITSIFTALFHKFIFVKLTSLNILQKHPWLCSVFTDNKCPYIAEMKSASPFAVSNAQPILPISNQYMQPILVQYFLLTLRQYWLNINDNKCPNLAEMNSISPLAVSNAQPVLLISNQYIRSILVQY